MVQKSFAQKSLIAASFFFGLGAVESCGAPPERVCAPCEQHHSITDPEGMVNILGALYDSTGSRGFTVLCDAKRGEAGTPVEVVFESRPTVQKPLKIDWRIKGAMLANQSQVYEVFEVTRTYSSGAPTIKITSFILHPQAMSCFF